MKFENLKEIMLMNSVDGERTPSGTYPKVQVDEAIQELVDILAGKDATIRKILSESLSKQNESVVFENKMADRIKELMEECRKYKLAEESANAKSKDLAMRVVELQDKVKSLEAENKACREELDHEREQFAITLDEMEKKVEHARSYKNVLKNRARTTMLWYRQAKKNLTEVEQDCAAFYERNKELEERCENLEHRKYALESKDEVSESELQQLREQLKNATDNANKYRELWCEAQQKVWNSQWTSVKDGLPKHNGNYAVVLEGVECIVPFDDCGQEFGWWERTYTRSGGVDGEEFTKADVTHWIELPPVPTKEKSDG